MINCYIKHESTYMYACSYLITLKPILTITSYFTIKVSFINFWVQVLYSYNVLEKHPIRMSFPINAQFWLDDFWIYMSTKLVLESFMTVSPDDWLMIYFVVSSSDG